MDGSNTLKMQRALRVAMDSAPAASAEEIAIEVRTRHAALFADWATEKLTVSARSELRARKLASRQPDPYQMFFEGFKSLTERLPQKGHTIPLAKATVTDLRRTLSVLHGQADAIKQPTLALIEEMSPYSKVEHGLTVARYCELRAAGVTPKSLRAERLARRRGRRRVAGAQA